jgi:iron complex outermembrane recepter protein
MMGRTQLAATPDSSRPEKATGAAQRALRRGAWRAAAACGGFLGAICLPQLAAAATPPSDSGLQEVIVTAEKYKSTIQETPISLSALGGDQLVAAGITNIQGLILDVPGLSVRSAGPGLTEYEARGLASNGGAAPTVGFYLDEIPLSPPALSQSGKVVIDPSLYDIDRVEVLRGPQGTLYGSGSMGGTVKIITNQPKLGVYDGSVEGMLSQTHGGGTNYSGHFMLNLPLGDKMALRVVAGDQYRSGWLDLVTLNPFPFSLTTTTQGNVATAPVTNVIHEANDAQTWVARASLLYQPTEGLAITATAFRQQLVMGGYDLVDGFPTSSAAPPVYPAHYEAFPLRESIHDAISIFGLTVTANLGFADLTSASSYWERLGKQGEDASESLYWSNGNLTPNNPPVPLAPVIYFEIDPSWQISQEIRLTSRGEGRLHWVAGIFYSDLHSSWNEESHSTLNTQVPDGSYFDSFNPYVVKQTAVFADGSFNLTDQWKLAAGVRWYTYKSQQNEYSWGLDGPTPTPPPAALITRASDTGFNPRINLSYEPTKDLNLYTTIARGFRPGGANQILPTGPPINCTPGALSFKPDSVWNYEIGEKAKLFGNWLTINGDFYYIKWNGVQQVFTLVCGYQYYDNAGDGRSFGPELEVHAKLSSEWSLSVSAAYTDSKITSPNAAFQNYLSTLVTTPNGVHPCPTSGTCTIPILNVAKDTASLSLTYARPLFGDYQLTARIADSYVGSSTDVAYYFGYELPGYNVANARVILAHDKWSAQLFVDNLTNKVALMTANNTSFQFNIPQVVRYSTNQPRTIGTQFNYHF